MAWWTYIQVFSFSTITAAPELFGMLSAADGKIRGFVWLELLGAS
jgi:hypothetical protein